MRTALIVAVAESGVIGRAGGLPWHLSGDLKRFRALTVGKPVLMGRKTFESIGRPLPGRPNIVITRSPGFAPQGVQVAGDLDRALDFARRLAASCECDECMVIGGAAIYEATLPHADRLYLTEVHARIEGDTHFPAIDPAQWREIARERIAAGEKDDHDYSFVTLDRIAPPPGS